MGSNFYPQVSSPIKSIQRGSAGSATTITISAVDTSKTFVRSFSTGASGTLAPSGNASTTWTPSGGSTSYSGGGNVQVSGSWPNYSASVSISGGSTNLTTSEGGAYLANSTQITTTGACNYEVIEYN
jgi:hypothetical protein